MSVHPISEKLFAYLISNISGDRFEALAKALFAAELGGDFVPLGGMHDGGADGFLEGKVLPGKKPGTFYQFSITEKDAARTKVRQTLDALTKVGREPKNLIYATNQLLPKQDLLSQEIFDDYQVLLTIRDFERLKQLVNTEQKSNGVFLAFFSGDIAAIRNSTETLRGSVNQFVKDPTVFAFLDFELRERFAPDHLTDRVVDSLIYWALRDTDPDAGKLLGREEIAEAISSVFPTASSILRPRLNDRLADLARKYQGDSERIRHHKQKDMFCLPFEMRKQLAERALEESKLQDHFIQSIRSRLELQTKQPLSPDDAQVGTLLIFDSVHDYFVEQGLVLAAYLDNKVETLTISDQIVERQVERVLQKSPDKARISPAMIEDALQVLRGVFYSPTELERTYLGYLSRTSLLYMTLQRAPKMVEYFNQMGGNFRLLVGSDMLVKAISENQLPPERRQVEILLKACVEVGAKLVLTEAVLEEVFTHLHAVDLEYRNHYLPNEPYLSAKDVTECDRILIRAYYYARFEGKKISWDKFLNQFLDVPSLRAKLQKGRAELRGLLIQRFCMEYLSSEDIADGVNSTEVEALAEKLHEARNTKNEVLSYNDALMVHAVYRQRKLHKEQAIYDGFGFRTWWLTKETWVLNFTAPLVIREGGVPYIMRPEFILNFIALAPKAAHVRKSFRELLPTTVGLQLGQHLRPEVMHSLLAGTQEWASLSPERVAVMIGEKINRLKHDRLKRYLANV
ncbi:MAG: hypothetical protein OEL20_06490 [Sulfuritalea sp.]|nr:hypothetical protein [Sulfuritalea sp.]